jgi:glucosylglycerol-phosphate synthase
VQGEKKDCNGVLILSEFAGASVELGYAVRTNPYDRKSLKESLLHALVMERPERQMRMNRLYDIVRHYDINHWGDSFLKELENIEPDIDWIERATVAENDEDTVLTDQLER